MASRESQRSPRRLAIAFILLSASFLLDRSMPADAAELRWRDDDPPGFVVNENLDMVLEQFAAHQGLKAIVSEEIDGKVTMAFEGMTTKEIMHELASNYRFDWFYDGQMVHFFPITSISHQVLPLKDVTIEGLIDVLDDLQLTDERYPIIGSHEADVALVSGPPQYIALVEQALLAMTDDDHDGTADSEPHEDAEGVGEKTPQSCTPLTRRSECLPRVTYGYAAE